MRFILSFSLFFVLFLSSFNSFSQQKFTISGYIKDASNGEDLQGATAQEESTKIGVITNGYGYYALSLPAGNVKITYSFVGFKAITKEINLTQNTVVDVQLSDEELEAAEVVADKFKQELENTQMSTVSLTATEIKTVPVIFGEVDLIKILQLKPGVKSGSEGSSGLYVRGGGADQNLVLLDEAVVYNASHLFGFFSIFNADAVKSVDLYKGDFPAQYGGRLSSVLDVKLKEGNNKKLSVSGGIGLISSRITVEAPIKKDKSSFIFSARRTYFDIFTRQINKANEGKPKVNPIPDYYFYDMNLKMNFVVGKRDRIFVSGYFGRDVFNFSNRTFKFDFDWGNATGTFRWNRTISPKLFMNVSLVYSDYKYKITNSFGQFNFSIGSGVKDYNAKVDFDYALNNKNNLRFGVQATQHLFEVGRTSFTSNDGKIDFQAGRDLDATEYGVYVNDEYDINSQWKLNAGLRLSGFNQNGKWYGGLEPRVAARYKVNEKISLKASASQMYQYLNLVSNSGASLPTDIWYPTTGNFKPQMSQQVAAGASFLLGKEGKYLLSNELYYKKLANQVDLKDGAQIFANNNLEKEFVFGRGWGYGNEVYLEKKSGKLTGWIGYTISWTKRQFADSTNGNGPINGGKAFFPRFDSRHDLSIVAAYAINSKWTFSANFVYRTGNATSIPTDLFVLQDVTGAGFVAGGVQERSNFRLPAYHRADLNIIRKRKHRWGESDWTFSIYNVYNRRNAYFVYIETVTQDDNGVPLPPTALRRVAKQVALFPVIPSVTYNFKF